MINAFDKELKKSHCTWLSKNRGHGLIMIPRVRAYDRGSSVCEYERYDYGNMNL